MTDDVLEAEVAQVRAAALADDATLPTVAKLKVQACHLLDQPCTGRLGGTTTLGGFLDDVADAMARAHKRPLPAPSGEGETA